MANRNERYKVFSMRIHLYNLHCVLKYCILAMIINWPYISVDF